MATTYYTAAEQRNVEAEYYHAVHNKLDKFVAANCGGEYPTEYPNGKTLLYVFNPATGEHAYLNVETDTIEEPPTLHRLGFQK